jgi:curli biogenesis system outer membrane secretion channel CsgG
LTALPDGARFSSIPPEGEKVRAMTEAESSALFSNLSKVAATPKYESNSINLIERSENTVREPKAAAESVGGIMWEDKKLATRASCVARPRLRQTTLAVSMLFVLTSCASYDKREVVRTLPDPTSPAAQAPKSPTGSGDVEPSARAIKRKVAIARFTNETKYGAGLFTDPNSDRIGKQASDILASDLTKSGKFIVLERTDLHKLKAESELMGMTPEEFKKNLVGVDALILGSVVEFGRKDTGEVLLFTRSRKQVAHARVSIRLVDPRTGQVFFSESGGGEAALETQTFLGLGDRAVFDSTLNDMALSAAIANLLDKVLNKLSDKPWTSGILAVEGTNVLIAGGQRQGLRIGDRLKLMVPGKVIKSPQTGFDIQTPHTQVGELEVVSFFGDSETTEGSICRVVSGVTPRTDHIVQL